MFRFLILCLLVVSLSTPGFSQEYMRVCENGVCRLVPITPAVRVLPTVVPRRATVVLPVVNPVVENIATLSDAEIASAVSAAVASAKVKNSDKMNAAFDADREVGKRLTLRMHLRRLQRQGVDVGNIRSILQDEERFEMLYQGLSERYGNPEVGGAFIDTIQSFLKFLLDNQDSIFALIKKIIDLFSAPVPLSAAPVEYSAPVYSSSVYYGTEICSICGLPKSSYNVAMNSATLASMPRGMRVMNRRMLRRQGRCQSDINFAASGVNERARTFSMFFPDSYFNVW